MGHDGLARALSPGPHRGRRRRRVRPGDRRRPAPDLAALLALHAAAADVVSRAVVHAVLAAEATVTTPAGTWRSYRDVVAGG